MRTRHAIIGCASWNNQWGNSHQRLARNNQREIVANGAWNNQRGMAGLERFMEQSAGNGCRGNASWLGTISGEMVAVAAPAPSTLMDKVADCEGARHHDVILGAGKFCRPDSPAWCRVPHKHASITSTCATPPPTRATRESPPPSRCLSRSASPRSMFASSGLVGGGRARFHGGGCKRTRNPCTPGCCPCTPGCCQRLEMLCVLWLQLLVLVHLLPQQANASCSRRPTHRFDWWLERLECQRGKRFAAAAAARRLR